MVLTGPGKGKSSSAFGMVARALGWEMRVGIVQYIKGKWQTGERHFFRRFPDLVTYEVMGEGFTWDVQDRQRDIAAARKAWQRSREMIEDPDYDLVLLDELNIALRNDYLPIDEVVAFLRERPRDKHIVITGRDAKPALLEIADLVTEMTLVETSLSGRLQGAAGRGVLMPASLSSPVVARADCERSRRRRRTEHAEPKRIVSMNLCLDSVLVELVPHAHILGAQPVLARSVALHRLPTSRRNCPTPTRPPRKSWRCSPISVLASRHSAIATRNALKRVGVRFELFGVPQVHRRKHRADSPARRRCCDGKPEGEALVARIQTRCIDARPTPARRTLTAAIYQPGGLSTPAPPPVTGELMQIAGLENRRGPTTGVTSYRPLPLELLIAEPPDVLLVGRYDLRGADAR